MNVIDFISGGANFPYTKYGKIGDIIYPAYNYTNGWFCKSRWDLVTEVDKDGSIIHVQYIWDSATVRAIELMKEFPEILSQTAKKQNTKEEQNADVNAPQEKLE